MGENMDILSNKPPLRMRDTSMLDQEINQSSSSDSSIPSGAQSASLSSRIRLRGDNKTKQSRRQTSLSLRGFRRRKQPVDGSSSSSCRGVNTAVEHANADFPVVSNMKDDLSSGSRTTTRRRLSLNFLRRDSSVSVSNSIPLQREKSRSKDSRGSSKGSGATECSDFEERLGAPGSPSLADRTTIITELVTSPMPSPSTSPQRSALGEEEPDEVAAPMSSFNCATAILEHTYMERFCGAPPSPKFGHIHSKHHHGLPEDPSVQESIECIFASQLEDGLEIWDEEDTRPHLPPRTAYDAMSMVSPSLLQQSRLNRCDRQAASLSQSKKRYEQASLVYVGTFDPSIVDNDIVDGPEGPLPCSCCQSNLPALAPEDWPQSPLLLRPTAGKGTRVKGLRFGDSKEYFWEPGSHLTWPECLAQKWGKPCKPMPRVACCERCAILPINNGNEPENEALVIDFESDLFAGSLLLRLRHTNGTTPEPYDDTKGYFKGMNRRYQAVVRGRFKKSIPFTELRTGFQFDRPCGKLPAKWILRGGIKVLSFFAPQLDAKMEGERPHSLTPLGSTPQVICVDHDEPALTIEAAQQEPTEKERTLLHEASNCASSLQRARARKKAFDKLFVHNSKEPRTDPSKIYTFEFLQHLFNFQDFSIELGNMLGHVELEDVLDGQPLQIMASHGEHCLWSFDVWHESLWESAQRHDRPPTAQ